MGLWPPRTIVVATQQQPNQKGFSSHGRAFHPTNQSGRPKGNIVKGHEPGPVHEPNN